LFNNLYLSFDYEDIFYEPADLVKLTVCLNDIEIEELTQIVHEQRAKFLSRRLVEKVKEEVPRKQFRIAIQAKIGSKVVARETIKEYSKDYNKIKQKGDISRKIKNIQEQAEMKRKIRENAKIEVNRNILINILRKE